MTSAVGSPEAEKVSLLDGGADGSGSGNDVGGAQSQSLPPQSQSQPSSSSLSVTDAKKLPLEERMSLARQGPTLIFDGICNLCNGSMSWFQDRVRPDSPVWYMWAQHPDTHALLSELGISRSDILRSWAYLEDGIVYRGSAAWLRALRNLSAPWRYLSHFDYMPEFVRESVYNTVAANRYNALGHSDACQRPNAAMRNRFLHKTNVKQDKPDEATIPPRVRRRLLIVGCGPAGLFVTKKLASSDDFEIVVIEPKEYFEFTPGILRGMCHPEVVKDLVFELEPVLCDDLGVGYVQGTVTELGSTTAKVRRVQGGVLRRGRHEEQQAVPGGAGEGGDFVVHTEAEAEGNGEELHVNFDFCVIAAGSQYTTSRLWKVPTPGTVTSSASSAAIDKAEEKKEDGNGNGNGGHGEHNSYTLQGRIAELSAEHSRLERLNSSSAAGNNCRVSIFGAGLVGVELASEVRNYFPSIARVTLFDPQTTVLPALPESAQKYATEWFHNNNVELKLGQDFNDESVSDAESNSDVVYKCVGVAVKADFLPNKVRDGRGQVRTNRAMQVVIGNHEQPGNLDPNEVEMMGTERASIYGSGRIFAIGDCVSVQGVETPYVKDTYPAEAMAEVVVANLKKAKTVQCMRTCPGVLRELGQLQVMTLCSLGPNDGIFAINDRMVSWGRPSTIVKGTVQYTKMSDSRNEFLGRSFWSLVPHW